MYRETGHPAESEIKECREHHSEGHEDTRIAAVRDGSHEELPDPITNGRCGQKAADIRVLVVQGPLNIFSDHGKVVADEVEGRIAQISRLHDPPAITRVQPFNFRFGQPFDLGCWSKDLP